PPAGLAARRRTAGPHARRARVAPPADRWVWDRTGGIVAGSHRHLWEGSMRLLARLAVLAAIAASALVLPADPSGAAGPAVATSVALSANASCDDASLDLGLV